MGEAKRRQSPYLTRRTKVSHCINCGIVFDAFTNPKENDKTKPYPGAISICLKCHHIMIYGDDLNVRNPTDKEMIDIAGHPEVIRVMRAFDAAVKADKPIKKSNAEEN